MSWYDPWDIGSRTYHAVTGTPTADERRNQQYAVNDQIKAYKDQTALAQQQIDEARNEQDVQKRKINEKQIRALRNNFRPASGFLNGGSNTPVPASNQLPTKLGT